MTECTGPQTEVVVAPGKALRLADMIERLVLEVHAAPLDEYARGRFIAMYRATLMEVGSTLSDALLEELSRLQTDDVGPTCSVDELRVAMSQLEGWLHGLVEALLTGALSTVLDVESLGTIGSTGQHTDVAR